MTRWCRIFVPAGAGPHHEIGSPGDYVNMAELEVEPRRADEEENAKPPKQAQGCAGLANLGEISSFRRRQGQLVEGQNQALFTRTFTGCRHCSKCSARRTHSTARMEDLSLPQRDTGWRLVMHGMTVKSPDYSMPVCTCLLKVRRRPPQVSVLHHRSLSSVGSKDCYLPHKWNHIKYYSTAVTSIIANLWFCGLINYYI